MTARRTLGALGGLVWSGIRGSAGLTRSTLAPSETPNATSTPMVSYAASILSKCMQHPTEVSWDAAMHTMHYLLDTKERGITFRSDGNLEPVMYYDFGPHPTGMLFVTPTPREWVVSRRASDIM